MGRMAKSDPRRPENLIPPVDAFHPDWWYVAISKPRKEFFLENLYQLQGFDVYCPRVLKKRPRRKRGPVTAPLFTGYIFLHLNNAHEFYRARWTQGARNIVTMNARPVGVSADIIEEIRRRENGEGFIEEDPIPLRPGDRVRIVDGLFAGLEGFFRSRSERCGKVRIVLKPRGEGLCAILEIEEDSISLAS